MAVFQATFFAPDHSTGRFRSKETPWPVGPRNSGQSSAVVETDSSAVARAITFSAFNNIEVKRMDECQASRSRPIFLRRTAVRRLSAFQTVYPYLENRRRSREFSGAQGDSSCK